MGLWGRDTAEGGDKPTEVMARAGRGGPALAERTHFGVGERGV